MLLLTACGSTSSTHVEIAALSLAPLPSVGSAIEPLPTQPGVVFGFGVNGQPRMWGTDGVAVRPALDALVNDLGATVFRVEINRGASDWEAENDNDDPNQFNWEYYDELFSGPDFEDLWSYVRYLNEIGVTQIELAGHGLLPEWMGGEQLAAGSEAEYIEMLVAFLVHARTRLPEPRPTFTMFSPWNEQDLGPPEGFLYGADGAAELLHSLIERMDEFPELDDIAIVAPESSGEGYSVEFRDAVEGDPLVMSRLAALSFHRYGGHNLTNDWHDADPPQWLTEFNDSAAFDEPGYCFTTTWSNGLAVVGNLIGALQSGVTAGLVWTEYDAPHHHSGDRWETFGLLATTFEGSSDLCDVFTAQPSDEQLDAMTYEPKPMYHAVKHVYAYIKPGAVLLPLEKDGSSEIVAARNPDGSVAIVGLNQGDEQELTVQLPDELADQPAVPIVSTEGSPHVTGESLQPVDGQLTFEAPQDSVFTLLIGAPPSG